MQINANYEEKVYAGVLGKIIGVYLGRPFEGWTYDMITKEFGEINYYVHEKLGQPLIVTDDDISGTFTFLRAMPDYGNTLSLTPSQIGQTWLNYLIENRTILWWGGLGNSTEHTAYLRLKDGILPPKSGSMALNTKVVAEQIGAQIFVDGWAMIAPGDPELAADLAKRAGSVSHDGEAIYGAQVLAAMESAAFVESDINILLDKGTDLIPHDSIIYRLISDLRELQTHEPDWRKARQYVEDNYGYDRYGGNCHMVPNHALIILSLLYGENDFQKTLKIVNTSGWDTDCNSGNVGCLMGIKNGLEGLETGVDYRSPVADRLYLPTADGGRAISDALTEAYHIININRSLAGEEPLTPKNNARFHFSMPGSLQGFMVEDTPTSRGAAWIINAEIPGRKTRALRVLYKGIATGRSARIGTQTFIPQEYTHFQMDYELLASPTLYPGQIIKSKLITDPSNQTPTNINLYIRYYGASDELYIKRGPVITMLASEEQVLKWKVPDLQGEPIAEVGIEISSDKRIEGIAYLDYMTWDGTPEINLTVPAEGGTLWRKAWVNATDMYPDRFPDPYRIIQNRGLGMISQGTADWKDYTVEAKISIHLAKNAGVGFRVQGLKRFYAILIGDNKKIKFVKALDGMQILAEKDFAYDWDDELTIKCTMQGNIIRAWVNQSLVFEITDREKPFCKGGVALIVEEGRISCDAVQISPLEDQNN